MIMDICIRQENEKDYNEITEAVKTAFASAEHADGDEHNLVQRLRKSDAFVPELALVAEINGRIVGHIMFTKLKLEEQTLLALAPLAILPEYQRQGIGKRLIAAGHKKAAELGFAASVVLGDPKYYGRSGYIPAKKLNIKAPFDIQDEYFMAQELIPDVLDKNGGIVEYAKEFNISLMF